MSEADIPLSCRIAPRALATARAFVDQLERWTVRLGTTHPREAALFGWTLDWEGPLYPHARLGEPVEVLLVLEGLMDRLRREVEFMVTPAARTLPPPTWWLWNGWRTNARPRERR